jgi:hypothetical protein
MILPGDAGDERRHEFGARYVGAAPKYINTTARTGRPNTSAESVVRTGAT